MMRTDYCNCNKQFAYVPTTLTVTSFTTVGINSWIAPAHVNSVEYLVVGGGGGGGGAYDTGSAGGGGGGLVLSGTLTVVPGNTYSITVGAGGTGGTANRTLIPPEYSGNNGGTSKFATKIALGGGGGYRSRVQIGGSGFGGSAATGLTAPSGGNGAGNKDGGKPGGGGGGNGSAGGSSTLTPLQSRTGGAGLTNNISSSNVTYGAGGDGGPYYTDYAGSNGINNTGNGGEGASSSDGNVDSGNNGGNGGSGIVILKYYV
jgi:hypothetical protein